MAHTALNDKEVEEFFDSPEELQQKILALAEMVRGAAHFSVYTGAGVSTSAGIPDFRGPNGVWTRKAKVQRGEAVPDKAGRPEYASNAENRRGLTQPTKAHMAIVKLMEEDICKFLISSNCDGLHLASGVPPEKISEVHGNGNVEACSTCGACFHRGFARVRTESSRAHTTGRRCDNHPACAGVLRYTTVAFGQSMPDVGLRRAEKMAKRSDVVLTLGTSMRVFPSCDLPVAGVEKFGRRHKLVLVNLQRTPYDDECALRIFAKTDEVMELLMAELGYDIPEWGGPEVVENNEWRARFTAHWPFRSAGASDWFEGPHVTPLDDATAMAYAWDLRLRQRTGNRGYQVINKYLQHYMAGTTNARDLVDRFVASVGGPEEAKVLAGGLLNVLEGMPKKQARLIAALEAVEAY